jgi:hypothetical protein
VRLSIAWFDGGEREPRTVLGCGCSGHKSNGPSSKFTSCMVATVVRQFEESVGSIADLV